MAEKDYGRQETHLSDPLWEGLAAWLWGMQSARSLQLPARSGSASASHFSVLTLIPRDLNLPQGLPVKSGGDFPGGPGGKTLHSQCRGPGFNPWSGNYIPHACHS